MFSITHSIASAHPLEAGSQLDAPRREAMPDPENSADRIVHQDNPRLVFSNGEHLYLSSELRYLTKFSINGTLKPVAQIDLGDIGIESFAGHDEQSSNIWAIPQSGEKLLLMNEQLEISRSIGIPSNEGLYFTFKGEEFFIDSYNPPYTVYRIENDRLTLTDMKLPTTPFGRDFLNKAYGYPFPAFYYKSSRVVIGFDGSGFRRIGRVKGFNELMYDYVPLSMNNNIHATIYNDSERFFETRLSFYNGNFENIGNINLEGAKHSGSFCIANNTLCIMSHHQKQLVLLEVNDRFPL